MREKLHRNSVLFTRTPAALWKTIIFLSNAERRLNCNIASAQLSRWRRKIRMQMVWACPRPAPCSCPGWHLNWDSKSKWELEAISNGHVAPYGPQGTEGICGPTWRRLPGQAESPPGTCVCMTLCTSSWEQWQDLLATHSGQHQAWGPWTKAVPQFVRVGESSLREEIGRNNAWWL